MLSISLSTQSSKFASSLLIPSSGKAFYTRLSYIKGITRIFHFSFLYSWKSQHTSIRDTENLREIQSHKKPRESNGLVCDACQRCSTYMLHQWWNRQGSPILWNDGHWNPVRSSTTSTECGFPAGCSSLLHFVFRPFSSGWKFPEFLDWRICSSTLTARSSDLTALDIFSKNSWKINGIGPSASNFKKIKPKVTRAIWTATQEIQENVGWI